MCVFLKPVLVIIIICCIHNCSWAEDEALTLADFYFQNSNYHDAITEYLRFIFFNQRHQKLSYAFAMIGECYINMGKWKKAEYNLKQALATAWTEEERMERSLFLIQVYIARGKYSTAEVELLRIYYFKEQQDIKMQCAFYLGIIYIYTYKWKDAKYFLKTYFTETDTFNPDIENQVLAMLKQGGDLPLKSPDTAEILSFFLPGLGQIYGGEAGEGLKALTINTLTGTLLVSNIFAGNYLDSVMIFIFLFQRFYLGNLYHARRIVDEYNKTKNREMAIAIIDILLGR